VRLFSFRAFSSCSYFHSAHSPHAPVFIPCILLMLLFSFSAFYSCSFFHSVHSPHAPIFIPHIRLKLLFSFHSFSSCSYFHSLHSPHVLIFIPRILLSHLFHSSHSTNAPIELRESGNKIYLFNYVDDSKGIISSKNQTGYYVLA
jgi:hypothetical protein